MTHKSNPHEILGVSPTATEEELSAAYKKLVKTHHPDLHQDEVKKKESEEKMKEINAAYDEITNPQHHRGHPNSDINNINDFLRNVFGRTRPGNFNDIFGNMGGGNNFNFHSTQTISCELQISITKAILGGEVECDTPIGKFKIDLPPAAQPGSMFNIQVKKDNNSTIIVQVRVNVIIPTDLTDEQKKKLAELNL